MHAKTKVTVLAATIKMVFRDLKPKPVVT